MRYLLIIAVIFGLIFAPMPRAVADCPADLAAAEALLDECAGAECPPPTECPAVEEKECTGAETFKQIITDVSVKEAIIYIGVGLITGAGAYFIGQGK
jgi:hypothetical protein